MKKYGLIFSIIVLILFMSGCGWEQINQGHGYGGIMGNLYSGGEKEGILPDIEIRLEAFNAYADGSADSNPHQVKYENTRTMGSYKIDGLPEGTYKIRFFIKNYDSGYTYSFVPESEGGSSSSSTGTEQPTPTTSSKIQQKDAEHNVFEAYIKKDEFYIMPDIYLHKREIPGYGTIKGVVFSENGHIPIKDAQVSATESSSSSSGGGTGSGSTGSTSIPAVTDTTNAEGEFTLSKLESGKSYTINISANGYNDIANPPTITVPKDIVVEQELFLKPFKARITGSINFTGTYSQFFVSNFGSATSSNIIKITCDSNTHAGTDFPADPQISDNKFSFDVPSNLSRYTITATGLEPYFSNSVNYFVSSLSPGKTFIIPEDSIIFEYKHKTIIIDATVTGSSAPANSILYCVISGGGDLSGTLDTIEMHPYGAEAYRAYADIPYGPFNFKTLGAKAVNNKWTDSSDTQYNVDDNTDRILLHIDVSD